MSDKFTRGHVLPARVHVLIIGAGAIGTMVVRALDAFPDVQRVLVFDHRASVAEAAAGYSGKAAAVPDFETGLHASDLVVECASQEAVAQYGPHVLTAGRDLVVVSVGALANDALRTGLEQAARAENRRVYVPSGALGGVDALKAAREAEVTRVTLATTKPPGGLGQGDVDGPVTLFDGPARDAVKQLPRNVNVAAVLALAGVGFDDTRVRVVADPSVERNTHAVTVEGAFGTLDVTVRNNPFPENPATSHLAALSVIALLRDLVQPIRVGT